MRLVGRVLLILLVALMAAGLVAPLAVLQAQANDVTISVAVSDFSKDIFTEKLIGDFESAHPGVKVKVVGQQAEIPRSPGNLTAYFEAYQKYVNSADVLFIDGQSISTVATQAGFLLDLSPLVNEDPTLNIDDFYPTIWKSFQWDNGIWALPAASNVWVIGYDAAAFDKAGLAYPNDKWTIDDFDAAIRALAQKDDSGKVTSPGIVIIPGYSDVPLFRSLIGEDLFDASTIPNTPQLQKPAVEYLLDTWVKLNKEGYVGNGINGAPLTVTPVSLLALQGLTGDERKLSPALLPGGKGALDVSGFAVSAGTQHVQEAYALAAFLTTRAEFATRGAASPARKSLLGTSAGDGGIQLNIPADLLALAEQAVANGIALSDMRFIDYVAVAYQKMLLEQLDAKSALQTAEDQAAKEMQTAAEQKDKNVLVVATPVPSVSLSTGKVALKFGLTSFVSPLPNQDKWDQVIADFSANDPQVGSIELSTGFEQIDKLTSKYDCFYLPYNAVPNVSLDLILNLDPFLSADSTFDKADVLSGLLPQLARDNKTWALPIVIEPSILKYNSETFSKAGVPAPTGSWTVDAFKDALKSIKIDPKDPAPFVGQNTGGAHLLILIAAYGGLPLDYRTDPPTINFSDPATVDAIRQVLDLAKDGYIKYDALGNLGAGFLFGAGGTAEAAVTTDTLNLFSGRGGGQTRPVDNNSTSNNTADPYKPAIYPRGSKFAAISYNISTAYISASSQNPDACYRWISTIAKHPELFAAMPARRSLLNDPTFTAGASPEVMALYADIDSLLQDPNTISLPSQFSGGANPTGFLMQHWMFQAFDAYVLKDGDLEAELQKAESMSKGFQECAVNLPPLDASSQEAQREYIKQYGACAVKIDPSLKPIFDLFK